jgi:methylated-DNA-[protein]-cysteine S-methyltransferase
MTITHWHRIGSPAGELLLTADGEAVREIWFVNGRHVVRPPAGARQGGELLAEVERQLGEYFGGQRRTFDLPLAPQGTDFQRRVWKALLEIPFGTTAAYSDIAAAIGAPAAVRAVGAANGQNPISIVIPCHRIIGKDGSLTGYGGGLPVKQFLLQLEGAIQGPLGAPLRGSKVASHCGAAAGHPSALAMTRQG